MKKIYDKLFSKKQPRDTKPDNTKNNEPNHQINRVNRQIKKGRVPHEGFLHVPKTGGASIKDFGWDLVDNGYSFPVHLGHYWTLPEVDVYFPNMQVSFILRDPIERIISAFHSRLRQGRPRKKSSIWSVPEATAYSFFKSPKQFLKALISNDDYQKSAALFAYNNIPHLVRNYVYYFRDIQTIERHKRQISIVGHFENFSSYLSTICQKYKIPQKIVDKHYEKKHVSPVSTKDVLSELSALEIEKLKSVLSLEYDLYNSLKNFINC